MTDEFVRSLKALNEHEREILMDGAEHFYEELDGLLDKLTVRAPRSPEDDGLPDDFLSGHFTSGSAVRDYLNSVEVDWRLDAYLAVEDLLDELAVAISGGKKADQRLFAAIGCSLVAGPAAMLWTVWEVTHPPVSLGRGWPFSGFIVGLALIAVGVGELKHRLKHGAQKPGLRVRSD